MYTFRLLIFAIFLMFFASSQAKAQDQITPLAVDGDWLALAHRQSVTDPPDVCVASQSSSGFGIRADDNDLELRLVNLSWTLPAGVSGTIDLAVNGNKYSFPVTSNDSSSVAAVVSKDQLLAMVGDMNKSASMMVTVGNASPIQVSLNGSNTVITAFLTCADVQPPNGTNGGPGSNPFQSTAPTN